MARIRLTSAAVERLRPPSAGQVEYFDTLLRSFGVRLSYSGAKAWFVMTRVQGKLIRVTIGRHPAISLSNARKRAQEVLRLASEGIDPRHIEQEEQRRRQIADENTYLALATQFTERHVNATLRPSTAREYRRILFGKDTQPWHHRPISSINRREILDLVGAIDARGAASAAGLSVAYLRKFFNWCADRELIEASPVDRIRVRRIKRSRERVLSEQELPHVWAAFNHEAGLFGPLFKILLLTGQRRSEVAGMRWDELFDLDSTNAVWKIPGSRTKNHREHFVPLGLEAIAILHGLPRTGPFVFSSTGRTPISGFSKAKARVDEHVVSASRSEAGSPPVLPWVLHDLRRTMVTQMNERLGVAPHIVEAVVNHVSGTAKAGVAGVYNRALYLDQRRIALGKWAAFLIETAARKPSSRASPRT